MDYSLPGSSIHGIFQARVLEWGAIAFSEAYWSGFLFPSPGDPTTPRIEPMSPALAGGFFTIEPPGKPSQAERIKLRSAIKPYGEAGGVKIESHILS